MARHASPRFSVLVRRAWPAAAVAVLLLIGTASATGSGYNQSYTRSSGSVSNSAIDLVSVSSSDPGGNNISASFQVSGTLVLNSMSYGYYIYFGGSTSSNSSAWAFFTDNTAVGMYYSLSGGFSSGTLRFTNGGTTLTFSIAKTVVGPPASFGINAFAWAGSPGSASYSWLGTNYQGTNGGGGTCTSTGCTSTAAAPFVSGAVLYGIIGAVVAVAVILAVLLLMRRRKPAAAMPPPPPPPESMVPPPAPPTT